jgi:hypothetical protein
MYFCVMVNILVLFYTRSHVTCKYKVSYGWNIRNSVKPSGISSKHLKDIIY